MILRSRLDPNREDLQAAQGDPSALRAYTEFHSAINHAKSLVKRGLLIDFHGFNKDWVFVLLILFVAQHMCYLKIKLSATMVLIHYHQLISIL